MSTTHLDTRSGAGSWAIAGLITGLISGVIFLAFEMLAAGILGASAFGPPRMMSATVLGQGVLPRNLPSASARRYPSPCSSTSRCLRFSG